MSKKPSKTKTLLPVPLPYKHLLDTVRDIERDMKRLADWMIDLLSALALLQSRQDTLIALVRGVDALGDRRLILPVVTGAHDTIIGAYKQVFVLVKQGATGYETSPDFAALGQRVISLADACLAVEKGQEGAVEALIALVRGINPQTIENVRATLRASIDRGGRPRDPALAPLERLIAPLYEQHGRQPGKIATELWQQLMGLSEGERTPDQVKVFKMWLGKSHRQRKDQVINVIRRG